MQTILTILLQKESLELSQYQPHLCDGLGLFHAGHEWHADGGVAVQGDDAGLRVRRCVHQRQYRLRSHPAHVITQS
jgi:hypothetical protein